MSILVGVIELLLCAPQVIPNDPLALPSSAALVPQSVRLGSSSLFARPRVSSPAQRRGTPTGTTTFAAPAAPTPAVAAPGIAPAPPLTPAGLFGPASPAAAGAAASRLPVVVLQALDRGPISEREAALLVELLLSSGTAWSAGDAAAGGATMLLDRPVDPELLQVTELLEGGVGERSLLPLDATRLRDWFSRLDLSRDAAVSFLEWRDVTAAPLDLFRSIDASRDGLIRFDEFARSVLLNTAREGVRPVDAELFDWARATVKASEPLSPIDPAELEGLSDSEILARARAAIAAEAARRAMIAPPPAKAGAGGS